MRVGKPGLGFPHSWSVEFSKTEIRLFQGDSEPPRAVSERAGEAVPARANQYIIYNTAPAKARGECKYTRLPALTANACGPRQTRGPSTGSTPPCTLRTATTQWLPHCCSSSAGDGKKTTSIVFKSHWRGCPWTAAPPEAPHPGPIITVGDGRMSGFASLAVCLLMTCHNFVTCHNACHHACHHA